MNKAQTNSLLKIYIFVAIYSNALRIVLGKWGTLISDFFLVGIILYAVIVRGNGKFRYSRKLSLIFLNIFLLQIITIAEVFNPNITSTLYGIIEYRKSMFQILAFLLAYLTFEKSKLWENIQFIELICLPTILYGIKQSVFPMSIDEIFYGLQDAASDTLQYAGIKRAISFYSGPFHFGMLCSMVFCLCLAMNLETKKIKHLIYAVIALVGCYCSLTRTNLLCCIIALCFFALTKTDSKRRREALLRKLIITLIIGLVVFFLALNYSELAGSNNAVIRFVDSLLDFKTDSRLINRFYTWTNAFDMIKEHTIFGNGIGSAGDTMGYHGVAINSVTPHNMFIKVLVELGAVGFVPFITLILLLYKRSMSSIDKSKRYLVISLFAITGLNAMVGSTISTFPIMTIIWLILGMLCYERLNEQRGELDDRTYNK